MAGARPSLALRRKFIIGNQKQIQWYPGHMEKGFSLMQRKIKGMDCIIEIHDARIPLSGRNPSFLRNLVGNKPHILVLNKRDLISREDQIPIREALKNQTEHIIFAQCNDNNNKSLREIMGKAINLVLNSNRYNRTFETKLQMMVVGVPNVGKSTLINSLRNKYLLKSNANAVGSIAGVTRAVQNEVKVHFDPPIYIVDTPGILPPMVESVEVGMKLALCACLRDEVVGKLAIADFLLYWLNKNKNFQYVSEFYLDYPSDDINEVALLIANHKKAIKKVLDVETNRYKIVPDLDNAANLMITAFRTGKLGNIVLDWNKL